MRIRSARHGDCIAVIFETVLRLIFNRTAGRFLFEVGSETAALDHEAVDDAVEVGASEMPGMDIVEEVRDRLGRALGIEVDRNGTGIGVEVDLVNAYLSVIGGELGATG